MAIQRSGDPLDDDLAVINADDARTPPLSQGATPTEYVRERERIEDADIIQALREIDGAESVRWRIERVNSEDPQHDGYLGELSTEGLTADNIARRWGSGTFKILGRYATGAYAASRRIKIAPDAAPLQQKREGVPSAGGGDYSQWRQEEERRRERERAERKEQIQFWAPLVMPIVAAMVGRQGPDMTALVTALKPPDPMQQIAALKSLMPEAPKAPDLFSNVDKIIELTERLGGGGKGGGETSFADVLKELARSMGPTIGGMLEGAVSRAGANAPTVPVPAIALPSPSLSPSASSSLPSGSGDPNMLKLLSWLQSQLAIAIDKAAKNKDPSLTAERILDDLPDGVDPTDVAAIISRADWWMQLQRIAPGVTPHGQWFATMREEMLSILRDENSAPPMTVTAQPISPVTPPDRKSESVIDMPATPPKLGL